MKNLFFILAAMTLITCSEEDSDQRADFDYSLLNMEETQTNSLAEYPFLANGDTISKTYFETTIEKMTFEILEETIPGAVKLDPETGIITVNDATLYLSDEDLNKPKMAITIKAGAGNRFRIQKQYFKIYDVSTCEGSSAFLKENIYPWTMLNQYKYKLERFDTAEFSFMVPEAKKLCNFFYKSNYSGALGLTIIDETGTKIFNEVLSSQTIDDYFEFIYEYDKVLDISLLPNKKYTCKIVFEGSGDRSIIGGEDNTPLRFPINQTLYKIIETKLLDGSSERRNTGLIPVVLGLE
jgi:hypothetical protein